MREDFGKREAAADLGGAVRPEQRELVVVRDEAVSHEAVQSEQWQQGRYLKQRHG